MLELYVHSAAAHHLSTQGQRPLCLRIGCKGNLKTDEIRRRCAPQTPPGARIKVSHVHTSHTTAVVSAAQAMDWTPVAVDRGGGSKWQAAQNRAPAIKRVRLAQRHRSPFA